jgi:hypothetical protein
MKVKKIARQAPVALSLPRPSLGRGKSVDAALKARRTSRTVSDRKLSRQLLSNVLWAAGGVNRAAGPFGGTGRTAASASNAQEIDLYVLLEDGAWRYDPVPHRLLRVANGDLRPLAIGRGQRGAGAQAPVRLVYVVDVGRFAAAGFDEPGLHDPETQEAYSHVGTGLIAQSVYLFAAAHGLVSWFHNCDRSALAARLRLGPGRRALFGQTVGYPGTAARA